MNGYFITGTDTNIGKTLVSAVITLALEGYYWKPIESGIAVNLSDKDYVQQLTGLHDQYFFPTTYSFQEPLSPNHAAELENRVIHLTNCQLDNPRYPLIVEGAGGSFVPLNQTECTMDLIQHVGLPVIVVSRGTLGTMNHTLLTVAALRQCNIPIHGIVYSGELKPANQKSIEEWTGIKTLFHVPEFPELSTTVFQRWVNENKNKICEALV